MTLRKRIFLYLVLVSVIPIVLVGIVSYALSFKNISSNAINSNISISDRMASEVRKLLTDCCNMALSMEDSISYQQAMRKQLTNQKEIYSEELRISLDMYVETNYRPELFGIYLIGENGCSFKSSFESFRNTDLQ